MPRQKRVDRESMDDTREGGRYMEMTIELLGFDYRKMAGRAYGEKLLHCRRDAIGLLSLATDYLSEEANEKNSVEINKALASIRVPVSLHLSKVHCGQNGSFPRASTLRLLRH